MIKLIEHMRELVNDNLVMGLRFQMNRELNELENEIEKELDSRAERVSWLADELYRYKLQCERYEAKIAELTAVINELNASLDERWSKYIAEHSKADSLAAALITFIGESDKVKLPFTDDESIAAWADIAKPPCEGGYCPLCGVHTAKQQEHIEALEELVQDLHADLMEYGCTPNAHRANYKPRFEALGIEVDE